MKVHVLVEKHGRLFAIWESVKQMIIEILCNILFLNASTLGLRPAMADGVCVVENVGTLDSIFSSTKVQSRLQNDAFRWYGLKLRKVNISQIGMIRWSPKRYCDAQHRAGHQGMAAVGIQMAAVRTENTRLWSLENGVGSNFPRY
jgi:hypothetical protein